MTERKVASAPCIEISVLRGETLHLGLSEVASGCWNGDCSRELTDQREPVPSVAGTWVFSRLSPGTVFEVTLVPEAGDVRAAAFSAISSGGNPEAASMRQLELESDTRSITRAPSLVDLHSVPEHPQVFDEAPAT